MNNEERWQELAGSFMECLEKDDGTSAGELQAIDLCSLLAMFVPFRHASLVRNVMRGQMSTSVAFERASK